MLQHVNLENFYWHRIKVFIIHWIRKKIYQNFLHLEDYKSENEGWFHERRYLKALKRRRRQGGFSIDFGHTDRHLLNSISLPCPYNAHYRQRFPLFYKQSRYLLFPWHVVAFFSWDFNLISKRVLDIISLCHFYLSSRQTKVREKIDYHLYENVSSITFQI